MIRANSLKKISDEIIINSFNEILANSGFKYLKGKRSFKRQVSNFDQIISISEPHNALEFNEKTEEIFLKFSLSISIEIPKFDKWVKDKLNERSFFRHNLKVLDGITNVDFEQLSKEDFFTPTESQQFKHAVTSSLAGPDTKERTNLEEIIKELPSVVSNLDEASDGLWLFENRTEAFRKYFRLLIFTKQIDQAKEHYTNFYHDIQNKISDFLETDIENAKKHIQALEKLQVEAKLLLDLDFENPFSREISIIENQDVKVKLAENIGFKETLRLDLKLVDLTSYAINDSGELLLLVDNKILKKVNSEGHIIETWEISYQSCFKESYDKKIHWNTDAQAFILNNIVVNSNNRLIELKHDIKFENFKKDSIYPDLKDLVFDSKDKTYKTLYSPDRKETILTTYSIKGDLISSIKIKGNGLKINLPKEKLIFSGEGNSMDIFDFKGNKEQNIKYGNGNDRIALSPDGSKMVLHFYSTKSQVFDFDKKTEQVVWAHPTFLKDYKEKFYNDINHNFGMTIAEFSPNSQFLIGGADHGKYVFWETDKFKRSEMIPSEDSLKIFNWYTTSFKGDKAVNNYFKPYVVEHEGQKLFINRGYDTSKISFIDNGGLIITQNSDCLLIWNKEFKNVGYVYGIGNANFSESQYMATIYKSELIILKKTTEINDGFESSVFKEIKGEDSHIQYVNIEKEDSTKEIEEKIENHPMENSKKGFFGRLFKK